MYSKQNKRTAKGAIARQLILQALKAAPDLTREELVEATGLSYDSIRNQTANLSCEGLILSTIGTRGERRYKINCNSCQI